MKKTIVPSKQYFALSVLGFIMVAFIISECPDVMRTAIYCLIEETSRAASIFETFLFAFAGLAGVLSCIFVCPIIVFSVICMFLFSSRPIRFFDDGISLGYIKKDIYWKEEIAGIGIAPLASDNPMEQALCKTMGIYIAFGDYRKEDMRKYGIWNVWDQVELRKRFPRIINFRNRITSNKTFQKYAPGVSDASGVQVFDGMLWMTYTEENFRFLRNWLGSKYYEIDYPIAGESTQSKPE